MVALDVVTLESSDSVKLEIPIEVAQKMQLVARMMQDLGDTWKSESIPIPRVSAAILRLVIDFLKEHNEDGETSGDNHREFSEWDKKFFEPQDQTTLFSLIMAANFLQIENLLELCSKWVAGMIKGKSVEEIRKTFGIKNDFTPEEEEAIRLENAWCEE